MGLQKSQFLNSLSELGKIWKCNPGLYSKKSIFYLFQELGRLIGESPTRPIFKNSKLSLSNGKSLEVQPKTSTQKISNLNMWMNWENVCPNLSFTVENQIGNLHKISLLTFQA